MLILMLHVPILSMATAPPSSRPPTQQEYIFVMQDSHYPASQEMIINGYRRRVNNGWHNSVAGKKG